MTIYDLHKGSQRHIARVNFSTAILLYFSVGPISSTRHSASWVTVLVPSGMDWAQKLWSETDLSFHSPSSQQHSLPRWGPWRLGLSQDQSHRRSFRLWQWQVFAKGELLSQLLQRCSKSLKYHRFRPTSVIVSLYQHHQSQPTGSPPAQWIETAKGFSTVKALIVSV